MSVAIETLKKGDYFMLVSGKPDKNGKNVWQYEGYCRQNKKYCGTKFSDISSQTYRKKGTKVFTNFEF